MERDIDRILELYEAWRKRRMPSLLALLAPEIKIVQSPELPWGGEYEGHDRAREFFSRFEQHLDAQMDLEKIIDAGHQVVVVGRLFGKTKSTGLEFELPMVHIWEVQAGQVTQLQAFLDNGTMLVALGA